MLGGVTFTSNGKQVPEQTQHVSSRQGEGSGLCKSLAPTGMASRDRDKQQPGTPGHCSSTANPGSQSWQGRQDVPAACHSHEPLRKGQAPAALHAGFCSEALHEMTLSFKLPSTAGCFSTQLL